MPHYQVEICAHLLSKDEVIKITKNDYCDWVIFIHCYKIVEYLKDTNKNKVKIEGQCARMLLIWGSCFWKQEITDGMLKTV